MYLFNSPKVSSWLIGREIGFCRKKLRFDKSQTIQNIARDNFNSSMITINEGSILCREIIRAEDFVAVSQNAIISLWNISLGIKIWEYSKFPHVRDLSMSLKYKELLVDKDGLIAQIYRSEYPNEETYVEFFFEGVKTGTIYFKNYLNKFQLINGYFFARGIDSEPARESNGCLLKEKLYLYQWDKTGFLITKISLAPFSKNNDFIFENNTRNLTIEKFLSMKFKSENYFSLEFPVMIDRNRYKIILYDNSEFEKYFDSSNYSVINLQPADATVEVQRKFIAFSMIDDENQDCLADDSLLQNIAIHYLKNLKDEYYNQ